MMDELYAYTKTNETNVWSMLGPLSEIRSECFSRTRRVRVTIEDAPEEAERRSCVGCVHAYNLDPLTKADPCLRCLSVDAVRKNWTAPEPAPVPMTPEYAFVHRERTFTRVGNGVHTIRYVGDAGILNESGLCVSYRILANECRWVNDGTPCAMPAGGA